MRSNLASDSEEDERNGDALVKQIKIYPLSKADNPPAQRFVDMTDTMYDGLVHYDESIYTNLARMLNEEPVQPQDLQMMGMLLSLGIEKGKDFTPGAATVALLKSAAAEAQAWLLAQVPTFVIDYWPNSQWKPADLANRPTDGIQMDGRQLFRRGFARHRLLHLLPPSREARQRQLLSRC